MKNDVQNLNLELNTAKLFLEKFNCFDLIDSINSIQTSLEETDFKNLSLLMNIFAPTCEWDDLNETIDFGSEINNFISIGNSVYESIRSLEKRFKTTLIATRKST